MKKLLALLLALLMVLSMAACSESEETAAEETAEETVQEETVIEEAPHYPVTVTDQAGREVVIEEAPETLVSGYYISSSALIALGQTEKFVGIEAKADKRPIYSLAAPELIALPSVGTAKEFDLEGCLALEPDLVILPMKLKDTAATLEEMDVDVLVVNPESRQQLSEMVALFGTALDCEEKAAELTGFIGDIESALSGWTAGAEAPAVYLAGNSSFLSTAGGAMYQSDLIELAGGDNVAAEIEDTYWAEVSYEQVLAWDPAYIILASDASYTVEDVLADPALAGCTAVANGNVYQLPSDVEAWDSPVPGGILGAVWTASVLHPELVAADVVDMTVETFYATFYGFEYQV